jgi:DNA-directed RNA polymerase subunit M/transcription elongation factor TFIIS
MTYRSDVKIKFLNLINNENIVNNIEQGIYDFVVNKCIKNNMVTNEDNKYFKRHYLNKAVSLYDNIDKNSYIKNETLIEKIINGCIDPYNLANLKPQELFPEHWNEFIERKKLENDIIYSKKLVPVTDQYYCPKCKKNSTTYYELQIRSSDEPMTLFITCLNCNFHWRK